MWTRKNLKDKAKRSFKANYWKTVLVGLVLATVVGGTSFMSFGVPSILPNPFSSSERVQESAHYESLNTDGYSQKELNELVGEMDSYDQEYLNGYGDLSDESVNDIDHLPSAITEEFGDEVVGEQASRQALTTFGIAALGLLSILVLVVVAVAVALDILILNPVAVGGVRFCLLNLNQQAKVRELGYAFDHNYSEIVKTMFFRDLRTFLWGLLLVVPGIVKSYEYRMIPYLLAEDPEMTMERAFAESKRMMDGNKWRAFVLDLSFLGWELLSILTLGILQLLYVAPYQYMTDAALYEELRYGVTGSEGPADIEVPVPPMAQVDAPESV